MIHTADAVIFDPAKRELHMPVWAKLSYEVRFARGPAIIREMFAHDVDVFGATRLHVVEHRDRYPKPAEIASRECLRATLIDSQLRPVRTIVKRRKKFHR